ncbi:Uncharacterized protein HZ326_29991 [Fusarium oxysporum f. sp. albedinis]|nr:Uncharacterized protein HZ326_29991 [Fusarium oxysporum f. sp. albedinis]
MSAGVLRGSTKVVFDEFLEILFQLCVTLCTETFVDGQPSSTLLVYFSGVLGFSADCHKFQLARQYCPKLSAIIYMQRILLLELALPMREYTTIGIPQRPRAAQFESLNRIRAKYMVLGSQYPLAEQGWIGQRWRLEMAFCCSILETSHRNGRAACCHQRQPQTRLLFHCSGRPWPTSRLTNVLTKATLEVWRQAVNARMYRQLAIAVTEKHVREVYTPFNRYDDCSSDADINVVFAWQSGHRPLQHGITYGLDGAYPFRLQPSLLRAYEWASIRWHEFLRLSSKTLLKNYQQKRIAFPVFDQSPSSIFAPYFPR